MAYRILGRLTVAHHGVPIGRTSLVEWPMPEPAKIPAHLREKVLAVSPFGIVGFEPAPGYESVRPIVQRASKAAAHLGFLGPAADPESDRRGRQAEAALKALCAELEFHDDGGREVAAEVSVFSDDGAEGFVIVLMGRVEDVPTGVFARRRPAQNGDADQQPPAV